ncbi:hypothetical protein C8R45DRAFT_918141 [Mycena sanguinolenta]|nr:hypothetical protein C8R45DRAFT_918141 [Mycena sanguinolenta]
MHCLSTVSFGNNSPAFPLLAHRNQTRLKMQMPGTEYEVKKPCAALRKCQKPHAAVRNLSIYQAVCNNDEMVRTLENYGRRELCGSIQIELRGSIEPRSFEAPEIPGLRGSALLLVSSARRLPPPPLLLSPLLTTAADIVGSRSRIVAGILSLYNGLASFGFEGIDDNVRSAKGAANGVGNASVSSFKTQAAEPRSLGISGASLRGSAEQRSSI